MAQKLHLPRLQLSQKLQRLDRKRDGAIVPIEVKAGNEASKSFDRMLARDDIHIGYKFINGNVGRQGKKVTLPHYMVMFV